MATGATAATDWQTEVEAGMANAPQWMRDAVAQARQRGPTGETLGGRGIERQGDPPRRSPRVRAGDGGPHVRFLTPGEGAAMIAGTNDPAQGEEDPVDEDGGGEATDGAEGEELPPEPTDRSPLL